MSATTHLIYAKEQEFCAVLLEGNARPSRGWELVGSIEAVSPDLAIAKWKAVRRTRYKKEFIPYERLDY